MEHIRTLSDERGAFAVLFAIMLTMLLSVAALVIDLGAQRMDVRANQTVADAAATAGASVLDPMSPTTAREACQLAWRYFLANSPGAGSAADPCGAFAGMGFCATSTPARRTVGTAGPYEVTFVYPVPAGDPLLQQRTQTTIDGESCQRLGMTIQRTRGYTFGNVIGAREGVGVASAVARNGGSGNQSKGVSMIILDPTGCNALVAKGQAQVEVTAAGGWPGLIAVDSSATERNPLPGQNDRNCSNSGAYAIDAVGTQNSKVSTGSGFDPYGNPVAGEIFSFALIPGQNAAQSYEEIDVTAGRLSPRPVPHERITRRPVDLRYNCSLATACPDAGSRAPEIDSLRALVGTSGTPLGFSTFPNDVPGMTCNFQPSSPPVALFGNWRIACSSLSISNSFSVAGGNVIFDGSVTVGSSGLLSINSGATQDRWVYFRSGDFTKNAQASVVMDRVMVYLHSGRITFGAGSGVTRWVAPFGGGFEDLALWSESSAQHDLGGQALLDIEGVFFTPNAYPMRFTGQGQQQQAKAQFITYRLEVTGQGVLKLAVDPERAVKVPLTGVKLIR